MKTKKRRKGTGSIARLPSSSWRAIYCRRDPQTGQRVRESACFATREQALAWLATMPRPPECCPRCGQTLPVTMTAVA